MWTFLKYLFVALSLSGTYTLCKTVINLVWDSDPLGASIIIFNLVFVAVLFVFSMFEKKETQ